MTNAQIEPNVRVTDEMIRAAVIANLEWEHHRDRWRKTLEAALSSAPAATAPVGWKLVPVDPTDEMLDELSDGVATATGSLRNNWRITYRNMLSSAPVPPSAADGKVEPVDRRTIPPSLYSDIVAPYAAALGMIRESVGELFGPAASLESEEAVLLRGPEPHHDAEAIIAALQRVSAAEPVAWTDAFELSSLDHPDNEQGSALMFKRAVAQRIAQGELMPLYTHPPVTIDT